VRFPASTCSPNCDLCVDALSPANADGDVRMESLEASEARRGSRGVIVSFAFAFASFAATAASADGVGGASTSCGDERRERGGR
tara:strand:+ start:321 stop:572 length:252 start_codon:yes stop_codon:yes gene_type:complete